MPKIADKVLTFAPWTWGEVEKFSNLYEGTYDLAPWQKRAVSGVSAHAIKFFRLRGLLQKLEPNFLIDHAEMELNGFTSAANSTEITAIFEAAILEVYSSIDCMAKVLHAVYGRGTRHFRSSTTGLFDDFENYTGTFPEKIKLLLRGAKWHEQLSLMRAELTHLATGFLSVQHTDNSVSYIHPGIVNEQKALVIENAFSWLDGLFDNYNKFLGGVFAELNKTLGPTPVHQMCGMVEGRALMRLVSAADNITFDSGSCASWFWFEKPENPTCPFFERCGA